MASRRRRLALAAGLVVLVAVAAAIVVALASRRAGDVSNPQVAFDRRAAHTTISEPKQEPPRQGHPSDDGFEWPLFGFDKQRTNVLPLDVSLRAPFRDAWAERSRTLIEFSPVLCKRSLYLLKNNGALYQVSRWTGHVGWKRKLGDLAASSPACSHGVVYSVVLRRKAGRGGAVYALWARTGRVKWARRLPSRSESSPLLDDGRLYFGSENGTVYALDADSGRVMWTYRAQGAVKGALALADGKLFFGDYSGHVYAIRSSDGHKVWKVAASGTRALGIGVGGGNFYSSAAVAYGRVYIGSTNGAVYSFSARNGDLAWRKQTGAYVYASPAVGEVAGGGPTVWIGSYNGTFYALDARTGRVRWSRFLGRKLSGTATVIGDAVFVSSLAQKTAWALGARRGRTLWRTRRGGFMAAISDGRRVYFNGYSSLFGLDPAGTSYAKRRPKVTPAR